MKLFNTFSRNYHCMYTLALQDEDVRHHTEMEQALVLSCAQLFNTVERNIVSIYIIQKGNMVALCRP